MKDFSEYEKMARTWNPNEEMALYARLKKASWVVTEKVHGANFSFVFENSMLRYAKRKEYLRWSDDFFAFQSMVAPLEGAVLALFDELRKRYDAKRYVVYGELFGGAYPHPEVKPVEGVKAIQTGVYYSPGIHFYAFDIAFEKDGGKQYLDFKEALELFERYRFIHAKPLLIGSLSEVSDFDAHINSVVPDMIGLPALSSNTMEGVVVKPLQHTALGVENRPVFKIKNKEFDEDERYHESQKWSYQAHERSPAEELSYILEGIVPYVNKNRVDSAVSKIGDFNGTDKRRQEICTEIFRDVLEDFSLKHPGILSELETAQRNWIEERLKVEIAIVVSRVNS